MISLSDTWRFDRIRRERPCRILRDAGCSYFSESCADGRCEKKCAICLESMARGGITTACNHSFHSSCLETWWLKSPSCPCCRREALPNCGDENSSSSEEEEEEEIEIYLEDVDE